MSQEKVNTTFSYNGAEYEYDIRDADMAEKFENAIEDMKVDEKNQPKTGKISELIKYQVAFLKKFFDTVLGEGAGDAICGEGNKLDVCYEAYESFLNLISEQKQYLNVNSTLNPFGKYSNRAQRRAATKK